MICKSAAVCLLAQECKSFGHACRRLPSKIAAQAGLKLSIGPLEHRRPQGSAEALAAEWSKHPLGQLIGEQCLYINLVRACDMSDASTSRTYHKCSSSLFDLHYQHVQWMHTPVISSCKSSHDE